MDWVWNWNDIVVLSGGWWLFLIGLLLLLGGILVGYIIGFSRGRDTRYRNDTVV